MSKPVGRRKREVEGQVVPFLRKLQTDTHGPERSVTWLQLTAREAEKHSLDLVALSQVKPVVGRYGSDFITKRRRKSWVLGIV